MGAGFSGFVSGFRVQGRAPGLGFRVFLGFRVWGLGFRV